MWCASALIRIHSFVCNPGEFNLRSSLKHLHNIIACLCVCVLWARLPGDNWLMFYMSLLHIGGQCKFNSLTILFLSHSSWWVQCHLFVVLKCNQWRSSYPIHWKSKPTYLGPVWAVLSNRRIEPIFLGVMLCYSSRRFVCAWAPNIQKIYWNMYEARDACTKNTLK